VVIAGFLLKQRDEIRWYMRDFKILASMGDRLKNFALVEENILANEIRSFPDLYWEVNDALKLKPQLSFAIQLNENLELLPSYAKQLFSYLPDCGVEIIRPAEILPSAPEGSNLYLFQSQLINLVNDKAPDAFSFKKDDLSLVLYKTRFTTDASHELAGFLESHKNEPWYLLRHPSDIQLEEVLYTERGTLSAIKSEVSSLPLTQVLKSFCNLIWKPFDVEAVYEFLNLPLKPFPQRLARKLTESLLEAPGVNSIKWKGTLENYWGNYSQEDEQQKEQFKKEQRQYNWWFGQTLYEPTKGVQISDFITRLAWISEWASKRAQIQVDECIMNLFNELADLCQEISELAQIIVKDEKLTHSDLNKLLDLVLKNRTQFTQNYSRYSSGVKQNITAFRETEHLFWFNFSELWEDSNITDFLWKSEIDILGELGLIYFGQKEAVRLMRYASARKILSINKQLILSYSKYHGTNYNNPHSFWLYLKSLPQSFDVVNLITEQISLNAYQFILPIPLLKATGIINVTGLQNLLPREKESHSSISNLIYFPHLYLLEYVLGLRNRLQSSLVLDVILKGKIIHKFVEIALTDKILMSIKIDKSRWMEWCDSNINSFIDQEAGLLNKSRYAIDRAVLRTQLYNSLFNLFDAISGDGWMVESIEAPFEKKFNDLTLLSGRTDIVLLKDDDRFIVDLKSGSSSYRETEIKDNADWQLLLYSYFGHEGKIPASSAYFTIQKGEFIGRKNPGISHFKEVRPKPDDEITYSEMLSNLQVAIDIRIEQIQTGEIEFRNSQDAIESLPQNLGQIEMKSESNKFDNYLFLNTI